MKVTVNREKNREKRGKNSTSTHIKPGEGGRPKGSKNRMPPISLVPQSCKDQALLNLEEGLLLRNVDYSLWLLNRMIPVSKEKNFNPKVFFEGIDLQELEGIKQAGIRIIEQVDAGVISIQDGLLLQSMLENQHDLTFNEMVDFLMKHMKKIKNNPEFVGSGQTMTEEQFLELEALAKNNSNNQEEK